MWKVILTGCAGFIGSHICEMLLQEDEVGEVIGIDNFDNFYPEKVKQKNLRELEQIHATSSKTPFIFLYKDLYEMSLDELTELFQKARPSQKTAVLHFAASAGVHPSINAPQSFVRNNVCVTTKLMEAAAMANVTSFIFASSSSIYGNRSEKDLGFREEDETDHPISPYAATKKACELMAYTFFLNYGLPVACLRLFSVYGPRQRPDLVIHKFMSLLKEGRPVVLYGDGSMERDFTYVSDIAQGVLEAMYRIPSYGYRIYNLGNHGSVSIKDLVTVIHRTMCGAKEEGVEGYPLDIRHLPVPKGDVRCTKADIELAKSELDYFPKVSLEEGLKRQWNWLGGPKETLK